MNSYDAILQSFYNMRANDTSVEKQAESDILEFMRQPSCVPAFLHIITNCEDGVVGEIEEIDSCSVDKWPLFL